MKNIAIYCYYVSVLFYCPGRCIMSDSFVIRVYQGPAAHQGKRCD